MRAVVCTEYGPPEVLEIRSVPTPVPKDNEALIKIHATTVVLGDCEVRGFNFTQYGIGMRLLLRLGFGLRGPRRKILGQQLAGEIVEVGKDVDKFKVGDPVFSSTGLRLGAYAEYVCLPESATMAIKPEKMSFEEASTIPIGGLEALHFMRLAKIQPNQRVLINGAGGSIGTIAVQLAKHYGAEVTAVDSSGKFDILRSLGAEHLIDYRIEDFTKNGETYDVIFDIVGKASFTGSLESLNEDGIFLLGNGTLPRGAKSDAEREGKTAIAGPADYTTEGLVHLRELIDEGAIQAVIDKTYRLEEMVDAHRFVEQGGKKGNVVVRMNGVLK
jgi:NADPH:quinone reductase-like Zn-dependent oxidoreductase